jgi:hypothetical protein
MEGRSNFLAGRSDFLAGAPPRATRRIPFPRVSRSDGDAVVTGRDEGGTSLSACQELTAAENIQPTRPQSASSTWTSAPEPDDKTLRPAGSPVEG